MLRLLCACVASLVLVGCGPSSGTIARAKTAEYRVSALDLFDLALAATQETYKIAATEPGNGRFATQPQFYSPEGGRQSPGADGFVSIDANSVRVHFLVEVLPTTFGKLAVSVTPVTYQVVSGSPKPRELAPDDPNLPPWIRGRVDSLAVAIYERAGQYAVAPAQ